MHIVDHIIIIMSRCVLHTVCVCLLSSASTCYLILCYKDQVVVWTT